MHLTACVDHHCEAAATQAQKAEVYTMSYLVVVTRAGHDVVQSMKASQCAVGSIKVVITNHHAMACMIWHDLQLLTDFR